MSAIRGRSLDMGQTSSLKLRRGIRIYRGAYRCPVRTLTGKETMAMQLLTDGLSYKMVADRMQITLNTVRTHIRNIYEKLQVHSKAGVISRHLRGDL
jgi:DNA-binding NarL/FixJ family response regulator